MTAHRNTVSETQFLCAVREGKKKNDGYKVDEVDGNKVDKVLKVRFYTAE